MAAPFGGAIGTFALAPILGEPAPGAADVAVIDAHLDYRDQAGGGGHGHASVIRRIAEHPAAGPIVSIGLRDLLGAVARRYGGISLALT